MTTSPEVAGSRALLFQKSCGEVVRIPQQYSHRAARQAPERYASLLSPAVSGRQRQREVFALRSPSFFPPSANARRGLVGSSCG